MQRRTVASAWLSLLAAASTARGGRAAGAFGEVELVSLVHSLEQIHDVPRGNLGQELPPELPLALMVNDQAEWRNLDKVALLHAYVARLPPDRIVLVLDYFDVVWLGCRRDLAEAFRRFGRPIVFGAEFVPYPFANESLRRLPDGYPDFPGEQHRGRERRPAEIYLPRSGGARKKGHYRYLNSGCIAGYAGALRNATERMLSNGYANRYVLETPLATNAAERKEMLVGSDDQVAWHSYVLHHPDEVALDYFAELFVNLYGFKYHHFELRDGLVWSRTFNTVVCFGHANGAVNTGTNLRFLQVRGIAPERCKDSVTYTEGAQVWGLDCQ